MRKKIIISGGIILLIIIFLLIFFLRPGKKLEAVEIRLQRLVGIVKLFDENGKDMSLFEQMRLKSGNRVTTADESLVMMSLDETKLITMEAESSAKINSSGKNLEVDLEDGNLFFNVTEKLEADATFDIRTSNMICGIRGTSGYSGKDANGHQILMVTDGEVQVEATNQVTGEKTSGTAGAGDVLTVYLDDEAEGDKTVSFTTHKFREEDLPAMALDAIRKDEELQERIAEATGFSPEKIIALAEAMSTEGQSMYGAAIDELKEAGISDAIPIMGQEAKDMVDTANYAADTAEENLELEIAIIEGIMDVLETGKEDGVEDEELSTLIKKSTECVCKTVKLAKDKGLTGKDLVTVSKTVSDTLVVSVDKMEAGKLTSKEISTVMDAITDVYSGSIEVASKESAGKGTDITRAVLGGVDTASGFVKDTVDEKMAASATGDELADALLGYSDDSQDTENTPSLAQQLAGSENENLVIATGTGNNTTGQGTGGDTPLASENVAYVGTVNNSSGGTGDVNGSYNSGSEASSDGSGSSSDGAGESSGGGGSYGTLYGISVTKVVGGTIVPYVDGKPNNEASAGMPVTLVCTTEPGYGYHELWVKTQSGKDVTVTVSENNAVFVMPAEPVTVSATMDAMTYTVTLNTMGGVINSGNVTSYTYGVGATLPTDVTREPTDTVSFEFLGWYTAETDGTRVTVIGENAIGDKQYYAYWGESKRIYDIKIEATSNGKAVATVDGETVTSAAVGTIVTLTASSVEGAKFDHWEDVGGNLGFEGQPSENGITFTMPAGNASIKAVFDDGYSLTLNASENLESTTMKVAGAEGKTRAFSGDGVSVTAKPKSGYVIDGFTVKKSDGSEIEYGSQSTDAGTVFTFTMPADNVTIDVSAAVATYDINLIGVGNNGYVKPHLDGSDEEITKAKPGDTVVLDITPNQGYELLDLKVTLESNGDLIQGASKGYTTTSFTMPSEGVKVTASFSVKTEPLYWNGLLDDDAVDSSSISVEAGGQAVSNGDSIIGGNTIVVTFRRNSGYKVSGIELTDESGNPIGDVTTDFIVVDDNSYRAQFDMPYKYVNISPVRGESTLTVTVSSPNATVIGIPENPTVDSTVSFTVSPEAGYDINKVYYVYEGTETEFEISPQDSVYSFNLYTVNATVYVVCDQAVAGLKDDNDQFIKTWKQLVADGNITLSGNTLSQVNTSLAGKLVLDDSINVIGTEAAKDCTGLTGVEFTNDDVSILDSAFEGCTGLTSIKLYNVADVGAKSFWGCSGANTLILTKQLTSIGDYAFTGIPTSPDIRYTGSLNEFNAIQLPQSFGFDKSQVRFEGGVPVRLEILGASSTKYVDVTFNGAALVENQCYSTAEVVITPHGFTDDEIKSFLIQEESAHDRGVIKGIGTALESSYTIYPQWEGYGLSISLTQ